MKYCNNSPEKITPVPLSHSLVLPRTHDAEVTSNQQPATSSPIISTRKNSQPRLEMTVTTSKNAPPAPQATRAAATTRGAAVAAAAAVYALLSMIRAEYALRVEKTIYFSSVMQYRNEYLLSFY